MTPAIGAVDRTGGRCFYCGIQLAFHSYGAVGARGSWEVDHFIPLASRGADQPYNWVPACIACTDKSDLLPWQFEPRRFGSGIRDPELHL